MGENKITKGKWDWNLIKRENGDEGVIITVDGEELHPTLADIRLMSSAWDMYSILKKINGNIFIPEYIRIKILEILANIEKGQKESEVSHG